MGKEDIIDILASKALRPGGEESLSAGLLIISHITETFESVSATEWLVEGPGPAPFNRCGRLGNLVPGVFGDEWVTVERRPE